jgi:protein phosphatase
MDLLRRIFAPANPSHTSEAGSESASAVDVTESTAPIGDLIAAGQVYTTVTPVSTAELPIIAGAAQGTTRPLAPDMLMSSMNHHLRYGSATDVGMVRTNNQDSMFTFVASGRGAEKQPEFGLFMVADGMGGHHDGEKASALTVKVTASQIVQKMYLPILDDDTSSESVPIVETLINAIQKANSTIIEKVPDGGTTATTLIIVGDLAYIGHVGDTRVYLVSGNEIEQITRDHSLVQRLIELGQLTPEEALTHPQRNVLYRALGQNDHLEVDAITRRLSATSRLLICSDGLWNTVSQANILDIIMQTDDPQSASERLVSAANLLGGSDNITAIVVHMPGT